MSRLALGRSGRCSDAPAGRCLGRCSGVSRWPGNPWQDHGRYYYHQFMLVRLVGQGKAETRIQAWAIKSKRERTLIDGGGVCGLRQNVRVTLAGSTSTCHHHHHTHPSPPPHPSQPAAGLIHGHQLQVFLVLHHLHTHPPPHHWFRDSILDGVSIWWIFIFFCQEFYCIFSFLPNISYASVLTFLQTHASKKTKDRRRQKSLT